MFQVTSPVNSTYHVPELRKRSLARTNPQTIVQRVALSEVRESRARTAG
jgi:hypothetical protein